MTTRISRIHMHVSGRPRDWLGPRSYRSSLDSRLSSRGSSLHVNLGHEVDLTWGAQAMCVTSATSRELLQIVRPSAAIVAKSGLDEPRNRSWLSLPRSPRTKTAVLKAESGFAQSRLSSLTHDPVAVPISHELVRGMVLRQGAMPCLQASAQVMRPFPLSSLNSSALHFCGALGIQDAAAACPDRFTIMAVDAQFDRMPLSTLRSRSSIVRQYFRRTATTRSRTSSDLGRQATRQRPCHSLVSG